MPTYTELDNISCIADNEERAKALKAFHDKYAPNICYNFSRVIECDNVRDTRQCRYCGRTWTERCNFDDDFS